MGQPKLIDPSIYKQAGIDVKTGLPTRMVDNCNLKDGMLKIMRLIDEQDAVNRFKWYNLPCNISSEELERLIYYKGQLCFFYFEDLDEFYFMPFALDGSIDFYGRYNRIHPVPMSSGTEGDDKELKKQVDTQRSLLSQIKLRVVKAPLSLEEIEKIYGETENGFDVLSESAVILWDYSRQLGQNIIPRCSVNEDLLKVIAEIPCFLRTSLIAGSGIKGVRVNDEAAKDEVKIAAAQVTHAALTGELGVPITASIELQELFEKGSQRAEDYLVAMQALENFRLSTYGLDNGGLFEKKAHKLESEQQMNSSTVGLVYADGLAIRQNFCNIVNSIWGLNIWCEPSESVIGVDIDGDGAAWDRNEEGQNSGIENSPEGLEQEGGNE